MNFFEQTMPDFEWTKQSEEVAQLVAVGELSDAQIAGRVGLCRTTVWHWRRNPEFAARVDGLVDDFRKVLRLRALSRLERRVDRLNRDWLKLQRIIAERAEDPDMQDVPGGSTGLLVKTQKAIGNGENVRFVNEYAVDLGTLRELREIEKQAAQELVHPG